MFSILFSIFGGLTALVFFVLYVRGDGNVNRAASALLFFAGAVISVWAGVMVPTAILIVLGLVAITAFIATLYRREYAVAVAWAYVAVASFVVADSYALSAIAVTSLLLALSIGVLGYNLLFKQDMIVTLEATLGLMMLSASLITETIDPSRPNVILWVFLLFAGMVVGMGFVTKSRTAGNEVATWLAHVVFVGGLALLLLSPWSGLLL
jgi:hypothetical protein